MPNSEFSTLWPLFVVGWALAAVVMLVVWLVQFARRDATLVDVAWAANLGLIALIYAFAIDDALPERKFLVAGVVCVWSVRLASHLLVHRAIGKPEDARYRELRDKWGAHAQRKFFVFFQAQALLDALLSIPFMLALSNPAPTIELVEWLGASIAILGVVGETTADVQLAHFKKRGLKGRTCREGLWRYSRHPNYFFEVVVWIGFALIALGAPHGWIALGAPALIFVFIWFVTGIPAAEAHALRNRGQDYIDYQRTTSVFVPWFPRAKS